MVTIIERKNNHVKADPRYRVTCHVCGTVFECNQSDCHKACVEQGFWDWHILCPNCHHECCGWYGVDPWETVRE